MCGAASAGHPGGLQASSPEPASDTNQVSLPVQPARLLQGHPGGAAVYPGDHGGADISQEALGARGETWSERGWETTIYYSTCLALEQFNISYVEILDLTISSPF